VIQLFGLSESASLLMLAWLLPLVGALVLWTFGPWLRAFGAWVGTLMTAGSCVAICMLIPTAMSLHGGRASAGLLFSLVTWLPGMELGLWLDRLSLLWALVITGVGALIHLYSIGYLAGDRAIARFFSYLNLFIFAMLTLVLSDNFIGLLIGWGLVGLASFLLIGYWFDRPSAVLASQKAFIINVVGDIGIMVAVFLLFTHLGTVSYLETFARVPSLDPTTLFLICLALFVGCAAKSAQVPLHTWLPDAMEGPTPVSALIHAATMVTAGVYLIARCAPLWDASLAARELVGVIGALTALTGAILGIGQWDIKRILAYSTMSQIGYMILGVGVGAYSAGVFHFLMHAFFKAALFLTAGLIIHALADEQDVRRMGGLGRRLPFPAVAMTLGTLAICGIFPFSGFFSKDAILYGVLSQGHRYLYGIALVTAGITAYYMFRMLFMVFAGSYRGDVAPEDVGITPLVALPGHHHAEESSHDAHHVHQHAHHQHHAPAWLMQLPVALLLVPTVFAGFLAVGGDASLWARYVAPLFHTPIAATESIPLGETTSSILVLLCSLVGIGTAYLRYATPDAQRFAITRLKYESMLMPAALREAFWFDAMIDRAIVRPTRWLGDVIDRWVEPVVIGGMVHEAAFSARWLGHLFRSLQTGFVRAYAFLLACGLAIWAAYYATLGGVR